jgi:uncharacterized protein (DUF2126 family)
VSTDARAVEAFWKRLERLRVEDMLGLAARPFDEATHAAAMDRATDEAHRAGLTKTIAAAMGDVDAYVLSLFNRSTVQPGWLEANWGRPGTIEDRANLAASLGEVVTALLLGDRISEADRGELLGPWDSLVEPD